MGSHADAIEVIETCADITDGTNIHPAIRKITAGLVELVEDQTLDAAATALILGQLVGAADSNLVHAIGAAIAHLTSPGNPALNHLDDTQEKEITRFGYLARLDLQDPTLATNTSEAIARITP